MNRARVHFVGGPLNGVDMPTDGDPPYVWRVPALLVSRATEADPMEPTAPIHLYRRVARMPHTGVYVYDHEGIER